MREERRGKREEVFCHEALFINKSNFMKRVIILAVAMLCNMAVWGQSSAEKQISSFLSRYSLPGNSRVRKASLKGMECNAKKKTLTLTLGNGAEEIYYTEGIVRQLYKDIQGALPDSLKDYKLSLVSDNHPIEFHVPNAAREGKAERSKLWKKRYDDESWVTYSSRPYKISRGLEGRHISLCQSHGKYYDAAKGGWVWQRPRLFCTTEDLFSQTFVIPYIIPMLENAGAIVYTPRDRFWQTEEVIVDNNINEGGDYEESGDDEAEEETWYDSPQPGFADRYETYVGNESPFGMGSCRMVKSVKKLKDIAYIQWIPEIPKSGRYPVYVSYQSFKNSADDVKYDIYHAGGMSSVVVNQKMGGGTWVYLGSYEFIEGKNPSVGMVQVCNICRKKGQIVSADAVRFGSGMGNIERGGSVSGLPRWAEAAKYSTQWYGMPDSCFNSIAGDEYRSDIYSRPKSTNEMAGGSVYLPGREGRNVPMEICMAFHTDAGYSKSDNFIGPLAICTTENQEENLPSGMSRYASRDLANMLLEGITRDMGKYKWEARGLWNRVYGETRAPELPSIILEMLSHQNFADLRLGYDPQFKFDLCRSIYKSVLRFVCSFHGASYVVEPLPVKDFSVELSQSTQEAVLRWTPVYDNLEPTAAPSRYVVYTRRGRFGWNEGRVVEGTSCMVKLQPDEIYSFKVCALNDGGKSFPSETLSACIRKESAGTVLIVNGFTRLEGPAWFNTESEQGFLLDQDPGVQYGAFAGFCGRQKVFTKSTMGSEAVDGLGYSGNELEGKVVMGNTFDYPVVHGEALASCGYSFTSMSERAFRSLSDASQYAVIDMIYGVQKTFDNATLDKLYNYASSGRRLILSGANLLKSGSAGNRFGVAKADSLTAGTVLVCDGEPFEIYRDLNEESYCVPAPDVLSADANSEVVVSYDNGGVAGMKKGNLVWFGFPLEAVKGQEMIDELMKRSLSQTLPDREGTSSGAITKVEE